jgi:hypothetical protein
MQMACTTNFDSGKCGCAGEDQPNYKQQIRPLVINNPANDSNKNLVWGSDAAWHQDRLAD